MADKHKALKLDLPGAPLCAHDVTVDAGADGQWLLPGVFHPEIPTPLGGVGEPTLDQAKAAVKAGAHVKFCDITDKQAEEAREWQAQQQAIRTGVRRDALRSGDAELIDRASLGTQA